MGSDSRRPALDDFFERLATGDLDTYIRGFARIYQIGTLERLAAHGGRITRRAAVLAIGHIGDFASNAVLGPR